MQEMTCGYCGSQTLSRRERNTRPYAEVLYVCNQCGASTKHLSAHNPTAPESKEGFAEPPAAGEWAR